MFQYVSVQPYAIVTQIAHIALIDQSLLLFSKQFEMNQLEILLFGLYGDKFITKYSTIQTKKVTLMTMKFLQKMDTISRILPHLSVSKYYKRKCKLVIIHKRGLNTRVRISYLTGPCSL